MTIVGVKDANILIDCFEIDLLDLVFQLPLEFINTDLVIAEITDDTQMAKLQIYIDDGLLTVKSLDSDEIDLISERTIDYPSLSIEDCSVWYLTEQHHGILLTGDGKLRSIVKSKGMDVHGILWLLDELVRLDIISIDKACLKIENLRTASARLPQNELSKREKLWCGS